MKLRMRTEYVFKRADNGELIGLGDHESWAAGVRKVWRDDAIETQTRVLTMSPYKPGECPPWRG